MTEDPILQQLHPTVGVRSHGASLPSNKKIPVVEMFGPTIEGEGAVIGQQTMFIRFGLCDYKCAQCDSKHAVDPELVKALAVWQTQDEIADSLLAMMKAKNCEHIRNITFSGGNPCIHELSQLVYRLHAAGKKVIVETQGTKYPSWLGLVDHLSVSPKSPGMGEKFDPHVFQAFLSKALGHHQKEVAIGYNYAYECSLSIKVVVFSAQDIEFAVGISELCKEHEWIGLWDNFYLSLGNPNPPEFALQSEYPYPQFPEAVQGVIDTNLTSKKTLVFDLISRYNNLSEEIMQDPRLHFAKFLPQLHVWVWGNETEK